MRDDICTIPISEVFEPKQGCPICRLRNMLETRMVDYITGAAMMEPDVRQETNRLGFCGRHLDQMLQKRNRLSVALTLDTHLKEINGELEQIAQKGVGKNQLPHLHGLLQSCFVCDKIAWGMERLLATVYRVWQQEADFRQLYGEQECLCLPHYVQLMEGGQKEMHKKQFPAFAQATTALAQKYLGVLSADVSHYCGMYDYRNAGGDWGNSKDSIERAVWFLTADRVGPQK